MTPSKNQQTPAKLLKKMKPVPHAPSKPDNHFLLNGVNLRNNDNFFPGLANQGMPSFDFNFSSVNDRGLSSCAVSLKSGMLRKVDFGDLKGLDRMSVDMDDNLIHNDIMNNHEIRNLGKRGFIRMGVEVIPKDLEVCSVALSDKLHWASSKNKKSKKKKLQKKLQKKPRNRDKWSREQVFGIVREFFEQEKQKNLKRVKSIQTKSLSEFKLDSAPRDLPKRPPRPQNKSETIVESGYSMTWEASEPNAEQMRGLKNEIGQAIRDIIGKFSVPSNGTLLALETAQGGSRSNSRFFLTSESGALRSFDCPSTPKKFGSSRNQLNLNSNNPFREAKFRDMQSTNSKTNRKSLESNLPTANPDTNSFQASDLSANRVSLEMFKDSQILSNTSLALESRANAMAKTVDRVFADNLELMKLNSKLDKASRFDFVPQLRNIMSEIVSLVEENPQKPYSAQQIIFYFQMEHSLRFCKLIDISKAMKFKIICYSLSSFVDIKAAFQKFENMGRASEVAEILKKADTEDPLIDIYELSPDEHELENFFFTRGNDRQNFNKRRLLCRLFKRLLVIAVSLLDLMKMFLNFKTGEQIYAESPRWTGYKKAVRNLAPGNRPKQLKIDPELMTRTMSQLLSQIDLRDLQIYISINKSVVKKNKYQDISFRRRDNNRLENIIISYDEHHQLFCPKFKRKDELTKFLFKYIKKQIFAEYKTKTLEREGKVAYKEIVSNYNADFLPDKATRKIFYSENINKKNLLMLKAKNPTVTESICKFVRGSLIHDLISKIYREDEPPIFGNLVSLPQFAKMFLHSSKKHVLLFKDCVIALETLDEVFQFV